MSESRTAAAIKLYDSGLTVYKAALTVGITYTTLQSALLKRQCKADGVCRLCGNKIK